jgi:membrane protein implicated in regulation of membrane protease activity
MVNPSILAVFLAWFGGVGYLLTRYSGLLFWVNIAASLAMGLLGAWILSLFLRFLQSREHPLDPADYEMVGVLGQVSMPIRSSGIGEILYIREGTRRCLPARSEDGIAIGKGQEVIVMRYDRGIAYVRTWDAMTQ